MITVTIPSQPVIFLQVLPEVYLKEVNEQFLTVAHAVVKVFSKYDAIPVLTGAAEHREKPEILHSMGLGWDWRSRDVELPQGVAVEIEAILQRIDKRYRVFYDTQGTGPHFHSEYRVNMTVTP